MNYVDSDCMHEQEHGRMNALIMKVNRKRVVLINVHMIVDATASGVNSNKAQYERAIGRATSARQIKKLKDLVDCIKRCTPIHVIVIVDFNERVSSENIKNFMNETGLCDVLAETNGVEKENREATHQHKRKLIDCVLSREGMLRNETLIELIECSEIVESGHTWHLTDIDFS